jgi:hypothetical protein
LRPGIEIRNIRDFETPSEDRMKKLLLLSMTATLLTPAGLLAQATSVRFPTAPTIFQPVTPAVEFADTTNASQAGVPLVTGYHFTVTRSVTLNALGAVLQGSSAQPIFGSLPASMPVSLWDNHEILLAAATVSASDPLVGHFNYHSVPATVLEPGVTYTIASWMPAGSSVMSDIPTLTTSAAVVVGTGLSAPASSLVLPTSDVIGRKSYLGAGFSYVPSLNTAPAPVSPAPGGPSRPRPMAVPGPNITATVGAPVKLDGSGSMIGGSMIGASSNSDSGSPAWQWNLVTVPSGSNAVLADANSSTPSLVPDVPGTYVAQLTVQDGDAQSDPAQVTITAGAADAKAQQTGSQDSQPDAEKDK